MYTITTRYLGPTNNRGPRVRASTFESAVTIPYDHSKNVEDLHRDAMLALCRKLKWDGTWVCGTLPNQDVVWTCSKSWTTVEVQRAETATTSYPCYAALTL